MRQYDPYQLSNLMLLNQYGPPAPPQGGYYGPQQNSGSTSYVPQYTGPGLTNQSSWGVAPYVPQYTGTGNTASQPLVTGPMVGGPYKNPYSYQGGYYVSPYEY